MTDVQTKEINPTSSAKPDKQNSKPPVIPEQTSTTLNKSESKKALNVEVPEDIGPGNWQDEVSPNTIPSIIEVIQLQHTKDGADQDKAATYINVIAESSVLPPIATDIANMSSKQVIEVGDGEQVRTLSTLQTPKGVKDVDHHSMIEVDGNIQADFHKSFCRAVFPCCFPPYCFPKIGRLPWIKYSELESQLRTGDIILFSGTNASCLIKCLLQSVWTHIALVVREPGNPDLLLFEATRKHNLPDVPTGKIGKGTMLVRLRDRLVTYESQLFCVRQLRVKRDKSFYEKFHTFVAEMHGRPWEKNMLEFVRAGYDGPLGRNYTENLDSVFCSELTAAAFKALGILGGDAPSNEYAPNNFTEDGYLPLKYAELGPQIRIILDKELPKPSNKKPKGFFRKKHNPTVQQDVNVNVNL